MNKRFSHYLLAASLTTLFSPSLLADAIMDALTSGKAYGDFRLRFENVDQDNALKDADALTLRSRLGYATGEVSGISALLEFEDSRSVFGMDDYNDGLGSNPEYSTVVDPETTELDQSYLQHKTDNLNTRLGRQVLTYDNHRFIGDVGWRQDRQTFDALSSSYQFNKEFTLSFSYIGQRNRIFAEDKDIDSKDHLLNAGYTLSFGQLSAYAYLLEEDNDSSLSYDTFGVRFSGDTKSGDLKFIYSAEFATQEKSASGTDDLDADYLHLEGGVSCSGITAKLSYEVLGSDNGDYGFATPLATLHKFNGWSDQFLNTPDQGLVDMSVSVNGMLAGGKWAIIYHDFEADESSATVDDLGDEIDFSYGKGFGKHYSAGIKYAAYSKGDINVDTDKLWLWVGAKF